MKNTLQTVDKYQWKGNKKQKTAMEAWLNPQSETFGNAYKSFKNAGFSNSYSLNITHLAPKWLSEYVERNIMTDEHIIQGIQSLAQNAPNSRSPDDTRLKAHELLMDIKGMGSKGKGITTNILVQPILGGESTRKTVTNNGNQIE